MSRGIKSRLWIQGVAILVAVLSTIIGTPPSFAQTQPTAEARLKEKGITLPAAPKPVANYVEYVRVGNLLFLAGHNSVLWRGKGKVGREVTLEQGYQAARDAGLDLLASTREALGSLDKVKRVVRVFGMVNSAPGFTDQPKVINGCSDLLVEVFGDINGKGARAAVGMAELPFGYPVEIEMVLEVSD